MKLPPADSPLGQLLATLPQVGRVEWIGLRPQRGVPMDEVEAARPSPARAWSAIATRRQRQARRHPDPGRAPAGDRGAVRARADAAASLFRRNLVVSGLPLVALKGRRFRIGDVLLEGTGPCDPCSLMEKAIGAGGYNAMRGHGGLCARIVEGGTLRVGDAVVGLR